MVGDLMKELQADSAYCAFCEHAGLGFFEEGNDLVAADAREALKEFVDRFAPFQVFDQCLDRHTGTGEHGDTSQDIR